MFRSSFRRALVMTLAAALLAAPTHALAQTAEDVGDPIPVPDPNTVRPSQDPTRTHNGLAMTPPMGWNSWNRFACDINEDLIRKTADGIVSSGMKDAGYEYVVIDDCWHGQRDANGFITADPVKFPSGIKALADYIHAKGLKFGIYSDAGRKTCGGRPGSQGHEFQDAITYARWGVDYLKYDWCNTGSRNAEEAYALMSDALRSTGRPIVFSLCEWGNNQPWLWAQKLGNLWRTTGDITDKWSGKHKYSWGLTNIIDMHEPLWPYAGPGHWNDPDMLEVGNPGLTEAENRSHFSLWAMMAAPLIAGNDVANMDAATRAILLNKEVIAVDQDRLGVQGRRIRDDGDSEVWVKPLAGGGRAVVLFNRAKTPARIRFGSDDLNFPTTLRAKVRDVWAHRDVAGWTGSYEATVPSHGVVMLRLDP